MRAKVAERAGGHAFEERFMKLDPLQLAILHRHAIESENQEKQEKVDIFKEMTKVWFQKFDNLFETLQLFTNTELYRKKIELQKVEGLREELSEENFEEVWDELMNVIPEEYAVEEPKIEDELEDMPLDPELEEKMVGWIQNRRER